MLRGALYELQRSLKDEPFSADEVESTKAFLDGYVLLFAQTDARHHGRACHCHAGEEFAAAQIKIFGRDV